MFYVDQDVLLGDLINKSNEMKISIKKNNKFSV